MHRFLRKLVGFFLAIHLFQFNKLEIRVVRILLVILCCSSSVLGQVQITTDPSSLMVAPNETFSITVQVETDQNADAAEVHLSFDPTIIEVTSISLSQPNPLPVPIIGSEFDNSLGVINYAAGTFSAFPNSDFDLLEIQFTAIAEGTTDLEFNGLPSKVTFGGQNILSGVSGSTITVAVTDIIPPVITLIGDEVINLSVGGVYTEQGANANDETDGDISGNVIIGGDVVDTNTVGEYVITYDVMDAALNPAVQVVRKVNVSQVVVNTYAITTNPGPNGTISPSTTDVNQGDNIIFTITPDSGFEIEDVLVNGSSVGPVSSYEFTDVQATATISATFIENAAFQLCIASGNDALTAFGRSFVGDPTTAPPSGGPFVRTGGATYLDYNGAIGATSSPEELSLFQKEIYGGKVGVNAPVAYEIPVPDGYYQVDLYFAEVYHPAPNGRVFDVLLEGNLILDEYDLVDPIKDGISTNQTAIVRTYYVQVVDGNLNVQIGPATVDNGKISGLCITGTSTTNVHPIANLGNLQFEVGEAVSETLNIIDGDLLNIVFNGLPSTLSYNPSTNQLEGTPEASELGDHIVNAIISDGNSAPVTAEFTVTIYPAGADLPPSIADIADVEVGEGSTASADIIVSDDKDVFNASIVIYDKSNGGTNSPLLPSTVIPATDYTFTDNGGGNFTLNWNTNPGDGRSYLVEVTANDGVNLPVQKTFNINVAQPIPANIFARTFSNPMPWYGPNPTLPFTVAIEANAAQNIGYIDAGDFVEYIIDVPAAGVYDIEFFAAKQPGGITIITVSEEDGVGFAAIGSVNVSSTSGWQTYSSFSTSVEFSNPGIQTIRLDFNAGVNLKNFDITQSAIAACNVAFRVNAGGPIQGLSGGDFEADQSVAGAGGTAGTGTPSPYYKGVVDKTFGSNAALVSNNTGYPDAIFQTERHIDGGVLMNWEFPANGTYEVNILFNENWTGEANPGNARIFDVEIEGDLVLDDYRPSLAAGGFNIAKVETFIVEVTDGIMNIDFKKGNQNPSVKGFSICLISEPINTPPVVSITAPANGDPVIRGTDVTLTGTALDIEDGDISNLIGWSSNDTRFTTTPLDGIGSAISGQFVTPGVQTLTATATDNGSEVGTANVTVNVSGPSVVIDLPLEAAELNSTDVRLEWTGTDVLYGLTEHYHLFVNPPDINNIDPATRISTASQIGQEFWDLTAADGIVDGQNTIVLVVADPTHAAFDNAEATAVVNFTVNLPDNIPPVITLLDVDPLPVELGSPYFNLGASATDETDGDLTEEIEIGGDIVDPNTIGEYVITYNVFDAAGNPAAEVTQTVIVFDSTAPVITCPDDIVTSTDPDFCGVDLNLTGVSAIDMSGSITFEGIRSDGLELTEPYALGVTTVSWTATDETGNVSEPCIQTITVNDEVGPNFGCPANINATSFNGNPVVVEITAPPVFDSCSQLDVTLTSTRNDGQEVDDAYPVGTTQIEWKATDNAGNISSCIQSVTVDFTASTQKNIESFSVQGQVGPEIIDASSGIVGVTVVAGTDVTGLSPSIGISADATINPSSGTVLDFTNSVNYTVTAQNGTQKNWTVTVTVQEDNEDPEITCLEDISISNDNGQCGAVVNYTAPVGTDNVPGAITNLTQGLGSGAFFPVGTTTEVYTVTDASGNTSSCSFTVTVLDSENPTISCPQDIVVQVAEGVSTAIVDFTTPLFSDNCPNANIQQTQGLASGSNFPLGTTLNIFEVTDAAGNNQTCSFNVTIETITPAALTVNGFTLVNADTDQDIMPLTNGKLINAGTYATTNLAIRANATPDVGSVRLLLSGTKSRNQTESVAPFTLYGDNATTGDYIGELFPLGNYTLTATPYANSGLSGNQGSPKTITFQFTNQNPLCSNFDASVATSSDPSACNSNDGSIVINTVGFVGPLTYNWSHNANLNSPTVSGLGAGTYNVTVTDANGCSEDMTVTLNGPTLPEVTLAPFADVLITDSPFALTGGSPSGGVYSGTGVSNNSFNPAIGIGNYSIVYTYEDGNGCANSASQTIRVGTPIDNASVIVVNANTDNAMFALTNGLQIEKSAIGETPLGIIYNAALNPGNVTFKLTGPINQNKSEGPSAPYSLFGDIGVDIQGKPFPIGNYTLVTSTSSGVSQTIDFSIISGPPANEPPVVALAGNPDNTVPFKINFSSAGSADNDGIITGYSWNFGDGNTSNLQNPAHTYGSGGIFSVSLTLTDEDNAASTKSISVTAIDPSINQPPIAVVTASPNSGTAPLLVNFSSVGSSDADGNIDSYEWDFGDGATSTQINPSHTYTTQGSFVCTLTVKDDDGAIGTTSVSVNVNAPNSNAALFILNANNDSQLYALTNGLQISKTDIGETPLGIIFNPNLNPGNVYFTLTGPISQTKSEGPSAPYSLFGDIGVDIQGKPFPVGNYTLVARPSVGTTQTINFSVVSGPPGNVNPIAVAIGNPDANTAFKFSFSSLGSTDSDGNIVGYSWNFGDGTTSTSQNPSHTYSSGGTKTVTLTVTDDDGGIGTTSIQVVAVDPTDIDKVVSFTLIDAENQFDLFDIQNNMNVNDGEGVNIRANTDPGIVGSVKFELSGTLTRTWTETNAPYALYGDFNGDYIPTTLQIGSYTLKATPYTLAGGTGVAGQSLTIVFNVVQSASTAKTFVTTMNISPNPANESVTVSFDEPTPLTQIYVYDITGRLVKFLKMDASENLETYLIGVQDLPTGSYFIRTIDAEGKELQQQMAIKR